MSGGSSKKRTMQKNKEQKRSMPISARMQELLALRKALVDLMGKGREQWTVFSKTVKLAHLAAYDLALALHEWLVEDPNELERELSWVITKKNQARSAYDHFIDESAAAVKDMTQLDLHQLIYAIQLGMKRKEYKPKELQVWIADHRPRRRNQERVGTAEADARAGETRSGFQAKESTARRADAASGRQAGSDSVAYWQQKYQERNAECQRLYRRERELLAQVRQLQKQLRALQEIPAG